MEHADGQVGQNLYQQLFGVIELEPGRLAPLHANTLRRASVERLGFWFSRNT